LSGYISRRNSIIWSAESRHESHENPLPSSNQVYSAHCLENKLWHYCSLRTLRGGYIQHVLQLHTVYDIFDFFKKIKIRIKNGLQYLVTFCTLPLHKFLWLNISISLISHIMCAPADQNPTRVVAPIEEEECVPHQKSSHILNYLMLCYRFYSLKVVIFYAVVLCSDAMLFTQTFREYRAFCINWLTYILFCDWWHPSNPLTCSNHNLTTHASAILRI
jgi:hypothetical protein